MVKQTDFRFPITIVMSAMMLAAASLSRAQTAGGAYVQDALSDGVVILEAEEFHASTSASE